MQSMQIFSEGAWNVRTHVCREVAYYCAKDVAKALGYTNPREGVRNHVLKEDRIKLQDLLDSDEAQSITYQARTSTYITEKSVKRLLLNSQMPNSMQMAKDLGIEVDTKYIRKEPEIVKYLQTFLDEMQVATHFQKTVGRYRIDLYLPDYKIAFEVDEFNHRDRDPKQERCREEFIRRALGCDFIRVDPDAPDFDIFKLMGQFAKKIASARL
jgi:prophage antirepressor-like protein